MVRFYSRNMFSTMVKLYIRYTLSNTKYMWWMKESFVSTMVRLYRRNMFSTKIKKYIRNTFSNNKLGGG